MLKFDFNTDVSRLFAVAVFFKAVGVDEARSIIRWVVAYRSSEIVLLAHERHTWLGVL